MIDRQYIPLFVFATCLALALALAVFTTEWPSALAVALAGCALGYAMRPPETEDHDTAFLQEDLAEIRAAGEQQSEDIAVLRTSVDEMAQIVESLATDMERLSTSSDAAETEKLRSLVDAMGKRVAALDGPGKQAAARLDTVEQTLATLRAERAQGQDIADLQNVEPVAFAATGTASPTGSSMGGSMAVSTDNGISAGSVAMMAASATGEPAAGEPVMGASAAGGSITERAGRLRDRFARGRKSRQVRVVPLFDGARAPSSLLVDDPDETPSLDGTLAAIRHALSLVGASDDPESRIFVRIAPEVIADPALADGLSDMLDEAGDVPSRLVVIVPQASVQGGPPKALATLLRAGARFGLERMMDWSADLDSLAGRGLAVIVVDGPAMAKSAISQKGDPTRLRQVLQARGIELLASEIETRMQLDAVNSLLPDLLAGPGLGEATFMDAPA